MLSDSMTADPLSEYSSISIFSRAFRASGADTTLSRGDDIDFMHSHLKSMELQSPQKLLEQAKTIVDGGMDFSAVNIPNNTYSPKVKQNRNEQRPDLGRKRARFSLNPNLGKPAVNLEANFDIDQFEDPDEYFMAYEKLENARKELRRQGVDISVNNIDSSRQKMSSKQPRPGMLRKPVIYTHRYLRTVSDLEETDLHTTDPLNHKSEPETVVQSDPSNEIGSHEYLLADIKNESSDIFDELLSSNIEDLDGDETVNFLQGRLKLKPTDVPKLEISDLPEAKRSSFMLSESKMMMLGTDLSGVKNMMRKSNKKISKPHEQDPETLVNPSDSPDVKTPSEILHGLEDHPMQPNASSDKIEKSFPRVAKRIFNKTEIHDTEKDSSDYKSPDTRVSEKLLRSLSSPLMRKSPLAAMQSLKKQVMRSSMKTYSFSTMDPDSSPEKNSEMVSRISSETVRVDAETNQKDYMSLGTQTTHPSRVLFSSPSPPPHQNPLALVDAPGSEVKRPSFSRLSSDHFMYRNASTAARDNDGTELQTTAMVLPDSENLVTNIEGGVSIYENSTNFLNEDSSEKNDVNKPKETEQLDSHIPGTNSVNYKSKSRGTNASGKVSLVHEDRVFDTYVEDGGFSSENNAVNIVGNGDACTTSELNSDNHKSEINIANNKRSQPKSQKGRKRNETSKRCSLAEAGTTWEAGVRRGTRIRMRPLEFWKGERFLYGRVHESLVTVIGVKYMSPSAKGDARPLKVQSYVADNFKALVEQAALH